MSVFAAIQWRFNFGGVRDKRASEILETCSIKKEGRMSASAPSGLLLDEEVEYLDRCSRVGG